jgi:hypothetical protein
MKVLFFRIFFKIFKLILTHFEKLTFDIYMDFNEIFRKILSMDNVKLNDIAQESFDSLTEIINKKLGEFFISS